MSFTVHRAVANDFSSAHCISFDLCSGINLAVWLAQVWFDFRISYSGVCGGPQWHTIFLRCFCFRCSFYFGSFALLDKNNWPACAHNAKISWLVHLWTPLNSLNECIKRWAVGSNDENVSWLCELCKFVLVLPFQLSLPEYVPYNGYLRCSRLLYAQYIYSMYGTLTTLLFYVIF